MATDAVQTVLERLRQDATFRQYLRTAPLAALADYDLTSDERLPFVLPNFGWLVEGLLAGMACPLSADAFQALAGLGVRALLSLTETPLPPDMLARFALRVAHVPLADFSAPTVPQAEQAVNALHEFIDAGMPVAVHCGAGLGRTGTILACFLVSQGTDAGNAITAVRARRPGSIETPEQEAAVRLYERHLRGR